MTTTTTTTELAQAWAERVRQGAFSPAVAGTREVRVFGQAGDAPVRFPQLRALAPGETPALVIDLLEPDERWALAHAERVVTIHQQAGRLAAEVARGQGDTATVVPFKSLHPAEIDAAYLRGVWRPDSVQATAFRDWERIQLWAQEYATQAEEAAWRTSEVADGSEDRT